MPKIVWSDLMAHHPDRHLVVARVDITQNDDIGTPRLRLAQVEISRLLRRLGLESDYALALVRPGAAPEIHIGFAARGDADRLAQIVRAQPLEGSMGWSSQRMFVLDEATRAAITASLAVEGELDQR